MNRWNSCVAVLLLSSLFFVQPAYCTPAGETVTELVALFANWNSPKVTASLSNQANQYIDYSTMAQMALGEDQWKKLSTRQQQSFVVAFERLIEQRYYVRWHKIFKRGKLRYNGETSTGGDILVKTNVVVGEEVDTLTWRLHPTNGTFKVVNLIVSGDRNNDRDLLAVLRPRLNKTLAQHGFNGLMTWLNRKAASGVSSSTGSAVASPGS